jgi:D-glycerate 3-kinase
VEETKRRMRMRTVLTSCYLGTHDIPLATRLITSLLEGRETKIPVYDKALFNGLGDRAPEETWETVNRPGSKPIRVIILEGWCVGFRALEAAVVAEKWAAPSVTLASHRLEDLEFVNARLRGYDVLTDEFDAFIHVDAEDTAFVYEWREQQEAALRREKGVGMSPEEVRRFVDGYFPAYELFVDGVRGSRRLLSCKIEKVNLI